MLMDQILLNTHVCCELLFVRSNYGLSNGKIINNKTEIRHYDADK